MLASEKTLPKGFTVQCTHLRRFEIRRQRWFQTPPRNEELVVMAPTPPEPRMLSRGGSTEVTILDPHGYVVGVGHARCNSSDLFDPRRGRLIAFGRAHMAASTEINVARMNERIAARKTQEVDGVTCDGAVIDDCVTMPALAKETYRGSIVMISTADEPDPPITDRELFQSTGVGTGEEVVLPGAFEHGDSVRVTAGGESVGEFSVEISSSSDGKLTAAGLTETQRRILDESGHAEDEVTKVEKATELIDEAEGINQTPEEYREFRKRIEAGQIAHARHAPEMADGEEVRKELPF